MKLLIQSALLLATPAALLAGPMVSKETIVIEDPACAVPFTGSVSAGYDSSYIFRGTNFGDHAPWAGIDLNGELLGLPVNVGTGDINPTQNPADSDELDVYASTTLPDILGISPTVGVTWYYFPEAGGEAVEPFLALAKDIALPLLGDVSLGALLAYEDATDGFYYNGTIDKGFDLTECLSLGLGAGIGFGEDYYGVDGANDAFAKIGLTYALTEAAALDMYVLGNFPLGDLESQGAEDEVIGGVSMSVGF